MGRGEYCRFGWGGGGPITRAVWRGGPRNRDFFGPWNGNERSKCHLGPTKSKNRFLESLNRFLGSLNKFGPDYIGSVLPFAFYNCVHTIHNTSSSISQYSLGTHPPPLSPLHIPPPPPIIAAAAVQEHCGFCPSSLTLGRKPECLYKIYAVSY
jgi:hypothetical protein